MTTIVMGSCRVREIARARTIPQFRALGHDPKVFLSACQPAGPAGNAAIALEAMLYAATQNYPVLYIEDDIDLDPILFPWALDLAHRLDSVTYLYLNDQHARLQAHFGSAVTKAIMDGECITRGAYAIRQRAALFGTQCVLIPQRLILTMVEILKADKPTQPWDGRLHSWLRSNRSEAVYSILPHPVQHRQDRTGRSEARQVMRSMSYGLPWVDAADEPYIDAWHADQKFNPVTRTRESIATAFVERRQRARDQQREDPA